MRGRGFSGARAGAAMKIVLAGGTGQLGTVLRRFFLARGDTVTAIGRSAGDVRWDGRTLGPWARAIDGADVAINLAGRSVNCRYSEANLAEMMRSRVDSTRVLGEAIAAADRPPAVWLQMSTATIYAHTLTGPHGEDGTIGGDEPGVPAYWRRSIEIALAWERPLAEASVPATRRVALRTAMVMSPDRGGVFAMLRALARLGLGGPAAGGRQMVSWIHHRDLARAIVLLIERPAIEGPVNLAAPGALSQAELM